MLWTPGQENGQGTMGMSPKSSAAGFGVQEGIRLLPLGAGMEEGSCLHPKSLGLKWRRRCPHPHPLGLQWRRRRGLVHTLPWDWDDDGGGGGGDVSTLSPGTGMMEEEEGKCPHCPPGAAMKELALS